MGPSQPPSLPPEAAASLLESSVKKLIMKENKNHFPHRLQLLKMKAVHSGTGSGTAVLPVLSLMRTTPRGCIRTLPPARADLPNAGPKRGLSDFCLSREFRIRAETPADYLK